MARWPQKIRPRRTLHIAASSLEAIAIVGRAMLPTAEEARRSLQQAANWFGAGRTRVRPLSELATR